MQLSAAEFRSEGIRRGPAPYLIGPPVQAFGDPALVSDRQIADAVAAAP